MSSKGPKESDANSNPTAGSKKVSSDTEDQSLTDAWGVPIKRVIQPKSSASSSAKKAPRQQDFYNSKQQQQSRYVGAEEYEDEEERDEDTSSEREWSGTEYEDKIAGGSKVQMTRARPFHWTSGGTRPDIPADSARLSDQSLQTKKKKKKKAEEESRD